MLSADVGGLDDLGHGYIEGGTCCLLYPKGHAHGLDVHALRGTTRNRRVSAARRALTWAAVGRGIRPVELSRYLGISRAAITAQLRTAGG